MSIVTVHMHQSGPIPGLVGWFSGGQTVTYDDATMTVVGQAVLAQRAYDASPLVDAPTQEEAPAQPEPTSEPVQPEQPVEQPAQPEPAPEPAQETPVEPTPEYVEGA